MNSDASSEHLMHHAYRDVRVGQHLLAIFVSRNAASHPTLTTARVVYTCSLLHAGKARPQYVTSASPAGQNLN